MFTCMWRKTYIIHYTCTDKMYAPHIQIQANKFQCTAKRSNSHILAFASIEIFAPLIYWTFSNVRISRAFVHLHSIKFMQRKKKEESNILIEMKNVYSRNRVCSLDWNHVDLNELQLQTFEFIYFFSFFFACLSSAVTYSIAVTLK